MRNKPKSNHFCKGDKEFESLCSECKPIIFDRQLLLTKELNSLTSKFVKLEKKYLKVIKERDSYITLSSKFKEQWLELKQKDV